jgi:hypothetical protein
LGIGFAPVRTGKPPMMDVVYIALTVVLLAGSWGLVRLCERV